MLEVTSVFVLFSKLHGSEQFRCVVVVVSCIIGNIVNLENLYCQKHANNKVPSRPTIRSRPGN